MIFDFILGYSKNGYATKLEILAQNDKETKDEMCLKVLRNLYNGPKIEFDKVFLPKLFEESSIGEISEYIDRLNSIENRYSKFLTPELTLALMNMEDCLESIQLSVRGQLKIEQLLRTKIPLVITLESFRQVNMDILSLTSKKILENILLVHETGIPLVFA